MIGLAKEFGTQILPNYARNLCCVTGVRVDALVRLKDGNKQNLQRELPRYYGNDA